jgi:allantoicase
VAWQTLLPETKLRPHHRLMLAQELAALGPLSHVRLNIFPDGGISRLRVYGRIERP